MKLTTMGLLLGLFIAFAPAACGGDDDDDGDGVADSGTGGAADAAPGSPDAAPGSPDAASGTPDASTGSPDADTGGGDAAAELSAEDLCRQYEAACGYGAPGRYQSAAQCVAALGADPSERLSLTCD